MHASLRLAALAAALVATPILAQEYKIDDLEIGRPYAFETPGETAAGYFAVTNSGAAVDSLVAIRTDVGRADVHATSTDASGVTRMTPVPTLAIPAGGTVTLQPGGLHVMFIGVGPLAAGDSVPATLVFEKAGKITVDFRVQARNAGKSNGDMPRMPGMSH